MGAYYLATDGERLIKVEGYYFKKLAEHFYFYNDYVVTILKRYIHKPKPLCWVCDYYKPTEDDKEKGYKGWDNLRKTTIKPVDYYKDSKKYDSIMEDYLIINHSKREFIDQKKLLSLYKEKGQKDFFIHPIPILTNSNDGPMGGGDYFKEDDRRGIWKWDTIELNETVPDNYKDITRNCLFFEE